MAKIFGTLFLTLFFLGLFIVVYKGLDQTLAPLAISALLAYLLFPVLRELERKGVKRTFSSIAVFLIAVLMVILALVLVIPFVYGELKSFIPAFAKNLEHFLGWVENILHRFGMNISVEKTTILELYQQYSSQLAIKGFQTLSTFLKNSVTNMVDLFLAFLNIFLVPFFTFFLLRDYEKILSSIKSLIPAKWEKEAQKFFDKTNDIFSGYFRGQLLVGLVLGIIYAIGLSIVGLNFGIIIGIISGFLNIIPYLGTTTGFTVAIIVGLSDFSYKRTIGTIIVFSLAQFLEGWFITPRVVGNRLGLGIILTILAALIGGNLGGIMGIVFAIPLAALVKYIIEEMIFYYKRSEFYTGK